LIKNIQRLSAGKYIVTVKRADKINSNYDMLYLPLDFSRVGEGEFFKMIFNIDGDFMDVYVEDEQTKLCQLINVNNEFTNTFYKFIMDEPYDLSNINWPKRADGTIDYAPQLDPVSDFIPTVKTTARLNLREYANSQSSLITTLEEGAKVMVLETGSAETIGGVQGNWTLVQTEDNIVGWCFGGFLEEYEPATPVQNNNSTASNGSITPLLVYGGIGAAVVLALVIFIVVVLVKRKKGE